MNVVRLVEAKTLLVVERILEVLEGGIDYPSFETQLKKELDQLGCDLLNIVLEALDQKLNGVAPVQWVKKAWFSRCIS